MAADEGARSLARAPVTEEGGGVLAGGAAPWVIAGVLAIPIFLLIFMVPVGFVGGLRETFVSSTWTLSYREVTALERLNPEHLVDVKPEPKDEKQKDESKDGTEE